MDLLNQDITILRAVPGEYIDGIYCTNERITITVKGRITKSSQKVSYSPELLGQNLQGSINVVTRQAPLFTVETSTLSKADIVVYDGKMYEIKTDSGKQKIGSLEHYRHEATLIEVLDDNNGEEPISGDPFRPNKIKISENGVVQGLQNELNFILGNGLSLDVVNDDTNGKVDITISNTATGAGGQGVTEIVANEDLTIFKVATSDGYQADSSNVFHRNKVLGLLVANINNGFSGNAVYIGPVSNPAWDFVIGSEIFLNGTELSTIPPTTGFIQSIGTATKTDTINIDLKDSILL